MVDFGKPQGVVYTAMSWFSSRSREIDDLRREIDTLKRELKNLQLDWTDMEQRLRRRVASLARANQRADELREETTEDSHTEGGDSSNGRPSLTSAQAQLQAQILARRAKLVRGGE